MVIKFKLKAIYMVLFIGILFALSDQISVGLFKDVFQRLRPCHNPAIANMVHLINGWCGGQYGFVSSHASNSFALAVFTGLVLKTHFKLIFPLLLLWSSLVSYSRVYVGVHYPGDILGGAILGTIIAIFVFWIMKKLNKLLNLKIKFSQ